MTLNLNLNASKKEALQKNRKSICTEKFTLLRFGFSVIEMHRLSKLAYKVHTLYSTNCHINIEWSAFDFLYADLKAVKLDSQMQT